MSDVAHISTIGVVVVKDAKGLERGSGGTPKTVGIHGGGLSIDIERDRCYAESRARWESGLADHERESAIARERAVKWYYTTILLEGDDSDPDGSMRRFGDTISVLNAAGWELVTRRIENNPMLTRGSVAMWCELRKAKTRAELAL